jgi:hypothetical protein
MRAAESQVPPGNPQLLCQKLYHNKTGFSLIHPFPTKEHRLPIDTFVM